MAETFGQRLARLRNNQGINQGTFANQVGVRQSLISMLETGERAGEKVQGSTLLRMAETLGVSMEYLLTGKERRKRRTRQHDEDTDPAREDLAYA